MSDRIDFGGEPWQAIPRRTLRDSRLSARAKGGLVTLLSHEEGWVRSCIAILMAECSIGRKQAQAIMAELRVAGYAEMIREKGNDNLVKTHYVVYAVPQGAGSQADLFTSPTYRKPGGSETGRVGKGAAVVEALDVEPLDEEPQDQRLALAPQARQRDEIADALARAENAEPLEVPASHMRTLCVKANELRRVAPDVTPAEVARRAANWPSHMGDATISGPGVVKWWGTLGAPANGRGPRDRAAEILRGAAARGLP